MSHALLLLLFLSYALTSRIGCLFGCDENEACDESTGLCFTFCNVSNDPECRDGTFCKENRCVECGDEEGVACPYYQRCYRNRCINGFTRCISDDDCIESAYCRAGLCDVIVCQPDYERTIINHTCTEAVPACYPTTSGNSCPLSASVCPPVCATHACLYEITSKPVTCSEGTCLYTALGCNPYTSVCNYTGAPLRLCKTPPPPLVSVPQERTSDTAWLSNLIFVFCILTSLLLFSITLLKRK